MTNKERWELNEKLFRVLWPEKKIKWAGGILWYERLLETWTPVSDYLTYKGMGLVIEEMKKRGCYVTLTNQFDMDNDCYAYFYNRNDAISYGGEESDTLEEAVAKAALAALAAEKEKSNEM